MTEWQPIASAPKDGTNVLLYIPNYGSHIHIGFFTDMVMISHGKVKSDNKHWTAMDGLFSHMRNHPEPSHWMPLPTPPTSKENPTDDNEEKAT